MQVKQFFKNVVSRFQETIDRRWEQITANLSLRMMVGRFGIWLMTIGRALQVRYANWNSEFRLKCEHDPISAHHCAFHVAHFVTTKQILSFDGRDVQRREQTPLVEALFKVKGVAQVILRPYQIEIKKGRVFSRDELRPAIERAILEQLTTI